MVCLARTAFCPDPLQGGDVAAIRTLLLGRLADIRSVGKGDCPSGRAAGLLNALAPVLVWARDHGGVPLDEEVIRFALQLRSIVALATRRIFLHRSPATGGVSELPVREMPEAIVYPLNAYLDGVPGYDASLPFERQRADQAWRQHGMVLFVAVSHSPHPGLAS